MPSSTPASQGYNGISFLSSQVQLARQSSRDEIPTIQSGDGPNMLTSETRWFLGSVLKMAKVFPCTLGCHSPRALMIVRMCLLLDFSSLSSSLGEPHLATCRKYQLKSPAQNLIDHLFQSFACYSSFLPNPVVRAVGSPNHVGEVQKPFRGGEVPGMGLLAPQPLEHHLVLRLLAGAARLRHQRLLLLLLQRRGSGLIWWQTVVTIDI